MREQLDKKQESLEDEDQPSQGQGRRRSSIWEGLAEVQSTIFHTCAESERQIKTKHIKSGKSDFIYWSEF